MRESELRQLKEKLDQSQAELETLSRPFAEDMASSVVRAELNDAEGVWDALAQDESAEQRLAPSLFTRSGVEFSITIGGDGEIDELSGSLEAKEDGSGFRVATRLKRKESETTEP